ncbi:MAG TPA: SusC/RagA family TonB-linked outer membrane protein [Chitinophaga sp.]|uniref:SusC/RagA family TonB-linked outer membrane protein n=1 Tax=Chitinophaga sp. TaxID=1869181 RepID=UPI002CC60364|nr:SusC/RagA family TonB-linked outer membrane protein [Chitinophaga sp.]HVI46495.1 SusC/RagA family TonB-linked outer membrane protein [Chitinophaga sp.]
MNNKSVREALALLSEKAHISFFYNTEEINKLGTVSLHVRQETVDNILRLLLKDKGMKVEHTNGIIAIVPAHTASNTAPPNEFSGRITDDKGIPLPYASVIEKGSTNGTFSDEDGNFHLKVQPNATVQVSYVGMQTKQIPAEPAHNLTVSLSPVMAAINEVVVNGYSRVKQKYSAASVTIIPMTDLDRKDQLSVDNMLEGKVPGLNINMNSTTPGAAPKIRLRGTSTLLGNREPVWVIDGIISNPPVKTDAATINALDEVNIMTSPVLGLNPKDIAQITVLKDAAATALYGVNSMNGVIMITTRNGTLHKAPEVTFSQMFNITSRPNYRHLDRMDASQRIDLSKKIIDKKIRFTNGILPPGFERDYTVYLNGSMTKETFEEREQMYRSMNTDWFDILFNNGVTQNYHLSVNGGGKKTSYYASVGYTDQKGPAIFTRSNQYAGILRVNHQFSSALQTGIKVSGSSQRGAYPYQINPYQYAYNTSRSLPYMLHNERVYYNPSPFAPAWSLNNYVLDTSQVSQFNIITDIENSAACTKINTLNAVVNADWKFLRSFKLHGLYSAGISNAYNDSYAGESTYYVASTYRLGLAPGKPYSDAAKQNIALPSGGEYKETGTVQKDYTIRHSLEYCFSSPAHYIQVLAGNELRQLKYDISKLFLLGYYPDSGKVAHPPPSSEYPMYDVLMTRPAFNPPLQTMNRFRQMSWYGMLVYSYKDRYTLNFNYRTDGANYFEQYGSNTWQQTWSAAVKWNLLDEPWIKKQAGENTLALRFSYGYNIGLPEINSPRLSVSNAVTDPVSGESQATVASFPNPGLRWEKTYQFNAGADFSFFQNRLNGAVDMYHKRSNDLLADINLAEENGISSGMINKAGLINAGVETSIQWLAVRRRQWQWTLGANISFNTSRILQTNFTDPGVIGNQQQYLNGNIIKGGEDPNTMYAYKYMGLDKNGLPQFRGIYDKDYTVQPTVSEYYNNVFVPVGNRIPRVDGSFTTSISYRNWNLSACFLIKLGYKQRLINLYGEGGLVPNPAENAATVLDKRWKQPGDENTTDIPRLGQQPGMYLFDPVTMSRVQYYPFNTAMMQIMTARTPLYLMSTPPSEMYNNSDIRTVDGSHVRLSTLSLQYTVPAQRMGKQPFKRISCYTQLHDVLLIASKELHGQDPELPPGTMPRRPSLTIGIDVNF